MASRYLNDLSDRIAVALDDLASKTNTVTLNFDLLAGRAAAFSEEDRQAFEDARAASKTAADLVRQLQRLLG